MWGGVFQGEDFHGSDWWDFKSWAWWDSVVRLWSKFRDWLDFVLRNWYYCMTWSWGNSGTAGISSISPWVKSWSLSWPWFGGQVKARVRFLGPFYPIASLLYFGIISFSFNSKIQHTTLPILTWTILMKTLSTEFEESLVCWLCIFLSRCWCHYRCYKSANEHRCLQREFESTDSLSFISKIYTFVMWDSPLYAVNTIG